MANGTGLKQSNANINKFYLIKQTTLYHKNEPTDIVKHLQNQVSFPIVFYEKIRVLFNKF